MRTNIHFSERKLFVNWRTVALTILILALAAACTQTETAEETAVVEPSPPTTESPAAAGLPNPASVYCEEQGYTLEMREGEGGLYGVCLFPDGSECEEWAFFRDECRPGHSLAPPAAPVEDGWQLYHSDALAYTFNFPADAIIEPGHDPLQTVTVCGPMVEDEYWPMIFISHPQDLTDYRIPEGADLVTWLAEHNLLISAAQAPEEQEPEAEIRLADAEIAGLTAVHTRFEGSPQSYPYDKYYFAHAGQLFSIVILHTGEREDWELYNRFLTSFQFDT